LGVKAFQDLMGEIQNPTLLSG